MQLQQGDVIMRNVGTLPEGSSVVEKYHGNIVLMHGENGHTHQIVDVSDIEAMFFQKDGKFYLKATKEVKATHEEHGTVIIPAGIWEIGQVREYDYFQEMERTVRD